MRISQLEKYRDRNPGEYFDELPPDARIRAYEWLTRFRKRWAGNLPSWRLAILVGQARRLALNPPDSAWGRKMLAKRGGLAVQRRYRLEGRNPTAYATRCRVAKQRAKSRALVEERMRIRAGLPPPERVKYLPTA